MTLNPLFNVPNINHKSGVNHGFHKTSIIICLFSAFIICLYIGILYTNNVQNQFSLTIAKSTTESNSSQLVQSSANDTSAPLKIILYWNDFFGSKDFMFGSGQAPFIKSKCAVNTCHAVSADDNEFPLEEIDAVVWHSRSDKSNFPEKRSPHTRYVFFLEESPMHAFTRLSDLNGIFNYTMTYRRDSDIYRPYGSFAKRAKFKNVTQNRNYAQGKSKLAAWFASNCGVPSQRGRLVEYLKEFIEVDEYGGCGDKICPKSQQTACNRMLENKYKFYFSFENSLCKDYVTEKFFNYARLNIVPVVYGLSNYEEIAPEKSFINVMDFKNVKELADYLLYLDKNDTAYNEYFSWKDHYQIKYLDIQSFCDLCEKLHTDKVDKVYADIYGWYQEDKCINGLDFLKTFV